MNDTWFYISSFGLLISGVLFFFLLGQYRAAAAAADRAETETKMPEEQLEPALVQMLYALPDPPPLPSRGAAAWSDARSFDDTLTIPPDPKEITSPVAPIDPMMPPPRTAPIPAPAATNASVPPPPAPNPSSAPAVEPEQSEEAPLASASPAAAYLQGLKKQLDSLQEEVHGLTKRLDEANSRDENMIARLAEIAKIVTGLNQGAGAPARPMLTSERDTVKELPYGFEEKLQRGLAEMIDGHFGDSAPAASEAQAVPAPKGEVLPPPPPDKKSAVDPAVSAPIPSPFKRPEMVLPLPSVASTPEPPMKPAEPGGEDAQPRRGPVWPV